MVPINSLTNSLHRIAAGPAGICRDFCLELLLGLDALMWLGFNGVLHVEDVDWEF